MPLVSIGGEPQSGYCGRTVGMRKMSEEVNKETMEEIWTLEGEKAIKQDLKEIKEKLYGIEEQLNAFLKQRDSSPESSSSFQSKVPANEDVTQEPPKDWIPMRQNINVTVPSDSEAPETK